jgi:sialate O-acetylesterase
MKAVLARVMQLVVGITVCVSGASVSLGDVTMPSIFGDHMVLQQGQGIPVWGWAAPGERVNVTLSGPGHDTNADASGAWMVNLPAEKAGTGRTLTVRGNNTLTFEDVAVGEVWLCSGQSNMEMGIEKCLNADEEIAAADFPDIRLIDVPKVLSGVPEPNFKGSWVRCSPETVATHGTWGGFSAAAYYFGRELHRRLDVPVGLIDSSWGGSRIEPWVPPAGFEAVPELKSIAQRVELADPTSPAHKKELAQALDRIAAWIAETRKALDSETMVKPPPAVPDALKPLNGRGDPTAMYNAMIHPLVPYTIRGVIWYQGEANRGDGMAYVDKTKAQILGWRKLWSNPDLPYYYVQIAPYQYGSEAPTVLPVFWEAQAAIEKTIPGTGMAVIHDVGNYTDIHPRNKQEVGRRLALLALNETYQHKDVVCRGPLFKSMRPSGTEITVRFENADGGLKTRDGQAPNWFEIGGDNGTFVKAEARIEGETVVLSSPEVKEPTAVRFAWDKSASPNLMNQAGLPAAAFRAGEIPPRAVLDRLVPEASDYKLVYSLNLPNVTIRNDAIVYTVNQADDISGPFDRVAYFLDLTTKEGEEKYVFVSMDPITHDIAKIGVPDFASGVHLQQTVANMSVRSNVETVVSGDGLAGAVEFWPCNYAPQNAAKVPDASETAFDFGDAMNRGVPNGYGSMQVLNPAAKQVVFAYNNWKAGGSADLGIGNSPAGNPDWTFTKSAGKYAAARLQVLVRPAK